MNAFYCEQLANGLHVLAECDPRAHSIAVGFFVETGSRDETDELSGVSHFLEHMVFKGTPRRTAADVNRQLDEMGSYSNARTSEERTIYYAAVLPEFQDRIVELLADLMRPSLRDDDFHVERQVILEEILMYEDQPPFGGHEKCMAAYFGRHPLARSVLGTIESISGLTPEMMREYFRWRYTPGNMALVATGRVDFDALVQAARRYCGDWLPGEAGRDAPEPQPELGFHVLHKPQAHQQYVVQICRGPAVDDPQRFAARLLSVVLGDTCGSRMYWELVDPGRAEYAAMGPYEFQGAGILMTVLCCAPEDAQDNVRRLQSIYRRTEAEGITEAELRLAKNKVTADIVLSAERPMNRLFAVGNSWMQQRRYRTVRELVELYEQVTLDDVQQVIQRLRPSANTTLAIGPLRQLTPPE